MSSSSEKRNPPSTRVAVAEPARTSKVVRARLLALIALALLALTYFCAFLSTHAFHYTHMDPLQPPHRHTSSAWMPAWVASIMRPHKCSGMHHHDHVQSDSSDANDQLVVAATPDNDESPAQTAFEESLSDALSHVHTRQSSVILDKRADNTTLSTTSATTPGTAITPTSPLLPASEQTTPSTTPADLTTPTSTSSTTSTTAPTSSSLSSTLSTSPLSQSESTSLSSSSSEATLSPPSTTSAPPSSDEITTPPVVTTVTQTYGGSTVVLTTTQSGNSTTNGTKSKSGTGSGFSKSNRIVVGVVVGVGGAIIVGIVGALFWLRRRSANQFSSGSWTFWRKGEKDAANDYLTGELGVRDRNINQGSNF